MFNFIKHKWYFFSFSLLLIAAGIVSLYTQGMNWDIDFTGGTTIQFNIGQDFDNADVQAIVEEHAQTDRVTIQKAGDNGQEVLIKTLELDDTSLQNLYKALGEKYGIEDTKAAVISTDVVSPIVGKELQKSAFWACLIALILMLIYIAIRFEFLSAVACVIALAHDVFVVISVYSIFQLPVNLTFVAAILTVLGYSNNDTIVVFDRIRENLRLIKNKTTAEIAHISIWETMRRTLYTGLTSLITISTLYIVGISSIKEFVLPIIIGIIFGTYSSVVIAVPLWILFVNGEND